MNTYMTNWFTTKEPRIHNGEKIVSSINGVYNHMQKNETGPLFSTTHESIRKSLKIEINIWNHKTPRKKNKCNKLLDTNIGDNILDLPDKAKVMKAKLKMRVYIKLKNFCTARETINKMRRQPTNGKQYLQITYLIGV